MTGRPTTVARKARSAEREVAQRDVRGGPYRGRARSNAQTPRHDDLRFRQQVSTGALGVIITLILDRLVVVWAPRTQFWGVVGILTSAGLLVSTWTFTARHLDGGSPQMRRYRLLLRGALLLTFAWNLVPAFSSPDSQLVAAVQRNLLWSVVPMMVAGFLYLAALFDMIGAPASASGSRKCAVAVVAGTLLLSFGSSRSARVIEGELHVDALPQMWWFIGAFIHLAVAVVGIIALRRLNRWMRVVRHEWWLDAEAQPQVEWASLAEFGNGAADVLTVDGQRYEFGDIAEADAWLQEQGFVSETEAVEDGRAPAPPRIDIPGLRA